MDERPLAKVTCTSSDCEKDLHYFPSHEAQRDSRTAVNNAESAGLI